MGLGSSKVVRGIHAGLDRLGQERHADPQPVMQRPELFQPLG
jgi:hypothetical protein